MVVYVGFDCFNVVNNEHGFEVVLCLREEFEHIPILV